MVGLLLLDTSCLRFICTNVQENTSPVQAAARMPHQSPRQPPGGHTSPPVLTLAAGGLHSQPLWGPGRLWQSSNHHCGAWALI